MTGSPLVRSAQVVRGGLAALEELAGPHGLGASGMHALDLLVAVGHGRWTERGGDFLNVILDMTKRRQARCWIVF